MPLPSCRLIPRAIALPLALATLSCASLHHVQISEIDNSGGQGQKFEIKRNETGVDVDQAASITKMVSRNPSVSKAADTVSDVWKALTFGPKTGEVTFSDTYGDEVPRLVREYCPGTRLVGFTTIRETNKYPVISGEIVRVIAYCK